MKAEAKNLFGDSTIHYLGQQKSNSLRGSTEVVNIHYLGQIQNLGQNRAREWKKKNKLKTLSNLSGKLADKALASLPGIIGSILSWILNRAKKVIGWLSQNLWALITGVGVLIYT